MATSQVKEINERTGQKVVVVDRLNRPRWSEAFENNPRILRNHATNAQRLLNAGGARPYIRMKNAVNWVWRRWEIKPGELWLSDEEKEIAQRFKDFVLIEPNTKVTDGNKAWPFERWQKVADTLQINWLQLGPANTRRLSGVPFLETNIRQAFAVLSTARLFVGTEGALHHAAAAFNTPAIVLWSEFISPTFTGYPTQFNIRRTEAVCGSRVPCPTCKLSMEAITIEEVIRAINKELNK